MTNVLERLRHCAEDPMWSDHAEVNKSLLREAVLEIQRLRERRKLPERRETSTVKFQHDGVGFYASGSDFADGGGLGEVFLEGGKAGSGLSVLCADAGTAASLALQYGCPVDVLRAAMQRLPDGAPAGPLGAALVLLTAPL